MLPFDWGWRSSGEDFFWLWTEDSHKDNALCKMFHFSCVWLVNSCLICSPYKLIFVFRTEWSCDHSIALYYICILFSLSLSARYSCFEKKGGSASVSTHWNNSASLALVELRRLTCLWLCTNDFIQIYFDHRNWIYCMQGYCRWSRSTNVIDSRWIKW